jgi:hypothetical protein
MKGKFLGKPFKTSYHFFAASHPDRHIGSSLVTGDLRPLEAVSSQVLRIGLSVQWEPDETKARRDRFYGEVKKRSQTGQ